LKILTERPLPGSQEEPVYEISIEDGYEKSVFSWRGKWWKLPHQVYETFRSARMRQQDSDLCPIQIVAIECKWYHAIYFGTKKVEGKKGTPKWFTARFDAYIFFRDTAFGDIMKVQNLGVNQYSSIREYLEQEGLRHTLPGVSTIEEGIGIYMSEPISWTIPEVKKYGILAFVLGKVNII
jgi:ASC-1-like (ASCH) protein